MSVGFSKFVYSNVAPAYAVANIVASQTDSELIAAQPGKTIRVLSVAFVCGATGTNATFNTKPAGAGTAISPVFQNASNGGAILPHNPIGWFETADGEGLSLTTGAGSTTGVLVGYVAY